MNRKALTVLGWLSVAAGLGTACGDDESLPSSRCEAPTEPADGPAARATDVAGFVRVQDDLDRTLDDDGVPLDLAAGRVQAGFGDFRAVTSTPARIQDLGPFCFGVTSLPLQGGMRMPLTVAGLRVEGTARGTVVATEAGAGTYLSAGEPLVPSGQMRILAEPGTFPGFDLRTTGLSTFTVSAPATDGTGLVEPEGMSVAWSVGDADWVDIQVTPSRDEVMVGGQVVCRVPDTGCFDLPVAASSFLLSGNASTYTMVVSRRRYLAAQPAADAFLEVEVARAVRFTLQNGVFE